jgi:hypothetical protein
LYPLFQLSAAAAAADSVYDKLRMFNGQAAAAAGWAWYGATAGTAPHLVNISIISIFKQTIKNRCTEKWHPRKAEK